MANSKELTLVKKFMIALFVQDDEGKWVRIEKSTALDIAMNPTVNERDYIVDQSPTKEVDQYAPTLNQSIVMYKGSPDYELLFPMAYSLKIGSKAKRKVQVVFMQEKVTETVYSRADAYDSSATYYSLLDGQYVEAEIADEDEFSEGIYYTRGADATGYKAWRTEATFSVTNFNAVDSTITVDINFGGTIERGVTAPNPDDKQPVFTKTQDDEDQWTDPFRD